MTEDEAKTKWCPMSRITLKGSCNTSWNIVAGEGGFVREGKCIASGCMMWRWLTTPEKASINATMADGYPKIASGYCGLGGRT